MSALIAFRYLFHKADILEDQSGKFIKVGTLDYASLFRQIVINAGPNGLTADETIRAVEVLTPYKKAIEAKSDHMLLSQEEYEFFKTKLASYRFGMAHEAVADYVIYARSLEKVDLTPVERPAPAEAIQGT